MSFISRIVRRFNKFLDVRIIFLIDTFQSIVASTIVLLAIGFFGDKSYTEVFFVHLWLLSALAATIIAKFIFKSYKIVIRHTSFNDLIRFVLEVVTKVVLMGVSIVLINKKISQGLVFSLLADGTLTLCLLLVMRLMMVSVYRYYFYRRRADRKKQRILVYGLSDKSLAAVVRLKPSMIYQIIGFIDKGNKLNTITVLELPVFNYSDVASVVQEYEIDAILFASEKDAYEESSGLIDFCNQNGITPLVTPIIDEYVQGKSMKNMVRQVRIEDLLGRDEIDIDLKAVSSHFRGKVVMVTGAAGSIGSELCRQLAGFEVKKLVLFDNAESPMHNIRLELEERFPELDFVPIIGDVRHTLRLDFAFRTYHPQVVFHAAAYKHVPLMEENPCEAIRVNLNGTHNVADKCIEYGVEEMIMISTDKAVNPTNIMGCTKRLAEIYVQSLGLAIEAGKRPGVTKFITTRFGNVLGSNGSVIPRFREQIEKGGPVTVTHPDITRFFMTIPEACRLVMEAATLGEQTQIFVFDMGKSVKIVNLARRMIELAGLKPGVDIDIEYTGLRPGEKLYEEVLSNKENTIETEHKRIFIAKVRKYDYEEVLPEIVNLEKLALDVKIPEMVIKMKEVVPEYISKNSVFEQYDHQK
ncbi:MAG: polysaccharide biosynthesis protein [Bacteroidales bacterium]|nr:polysaccharide biosynthesis protein [Bacteroidales bacterium]